MFELHVQNLTKRYGRIAALRDVSFRVRPGEILGLIGPTAPARPPCSSASPARCPPTPRLCDRFVLPSGGAGRGEGTRETPLLRVPSFVLGSEPGLGRNNAPPNPDLVPANNPVIRPPVSGTVGLWSKTDSSSYFKDYVVSPK